MNLQNVFAQFVWKVNGSLFLTGIPAAEMGIEAHTLPFELLATIGAQKLPNIRMAQSMLLQFISRFEFLRTTLALVAHRRVVQLHVLSNRGIFGELLFAMQTMVGAIFHMNFDMFLEQQRVLVAILAKWTLE